MKKLIYILAITATFLGITPLSHAMDKENHVWRDAFNPWKPEKLTKLLAQGFTNVDLADKSGFSALHWAACNGDRQIVSSLIEAGAAIDKMSELTYDTPLILAVSNRHVPTALLLLSKNANPAIANLKGGMPLHFAYDSLLLVKALLQRKAPVNAETPLDKVTPLHNACHFGSKDVVKLLIDHGAAVNAVNATGVTPLENALGKSHWEVCSLLLDHGASVNTTVDKEGTTTFHRFCSGGTVQQVEFCLKNGAEINRRDQYGTTPLMWAIAGGRCEIALFLINAGAEVNILWSKNGDSDTALSLAAFKGFDSVVKALLAKGAKLDERTAKGVTALHRAVGLGKNSTVQILLEAGANPNTRSAQGMTPLHHAVLQGNLPAVAMLLDSKAEVNVTTHEGLTPLHDATLRGDGAIVKLLIRHGAWLDKLSNGNIAPLMNALAKGNLGIALDLIEAGASVMVRNGYGATLLHYLVLYKNHLSTKTTEQWVALFLSKGIDCDAPDNAGRTALMFAAELDNYLLVKILLKNGAAIDATDRYGMTALHYAVKAKDVSIIEFLLQKGANKTVADRLGHTAVWYDTDKIIALIERKAKLKKQQEDKKSGGSKSAKSKKKPHSKTFAQRQELKKEAAIVDEAGMALQELKTEAVKVVEAGVALQSLDQNVTEGPEQLKAPDSPLLAGRENNPAPVTVRLASRVTDWFDVEFLRSTKAACLADPCKGYWHYKCGKLYHQLPLELVQCLVRSGRVELRKNTTYKDQMDTKWVLEGHMEFKDPAKNPWTPGKSIQRGFYHCTQGRNGLMYHVGFDAVNSDRFSVVDLSTATVIPDERRAIRHVLFNE